MKITMSIEIELPESMEMTDKQEIEWAETEVYTPKDEMLLLFSNYVGDIVGTVTEVKNLKWHES